MMQTNTNFMDIKRIASGFREWQELGMNVEEKKKKSLYFLLLNCLKYGLVMIIQSRLMIFKVSLIQSQVNDLQNNFIKCLLTEKLFQVNK